MYYVFAYTVRIPYPIQVVNIYKPAYSTNTSTSVSILQSFKRLVRHLQFNFKVLALSNSLALLQVRWIIACLSRSCLCESVPAVNKRPSYVLGVTVTLKLRLV